MTAYMEKADLLDGYISSNLRAKKHLRSRIILKMFKHIEHGDYYRERTAQRVKGHLKKLRATPMSIDIDTEAEPVPFEKVWEMAMGMLR